MKDIFNLSFTEDKLDSLVVRLHQELSKAPLPFCLWLKGDLGAGKTTLVRRYLYAQGLTPKHPVNSPTFTYIQEYEINGKWYAHLDLYRLIENGEFDELGLIGDYRNFYGYFVEWPEALQNPALLMPSHILEISFGVSADGNDMRSYVLKNQQPLK